MAISTGAGSTRGQSLLAEKEALMGTKTLLIIGILALLLAGGGYAYSRRR
jgi:hypothetical protein